MKRETVFDRFDRFDRSMVLCVYVCVLGVGGWSLGLK